LGRKKNLISIRRRKGMREVRKRKKLALTLSAITLKQLPGERIWKGKECEICPSITIENFRISKKKRLRSRMTTEAQ